MELRNRTIRTDTNLYELVKKKRKMVQSLHITHKTKRKQKIYRDPSHERLYRSYIDFVYERERQCKECLQQIH